MKFIPVLIGCLIIWLLIAAWLKFYAQSALMLHDEHGTIKLELTELHMQAREERKEISNKLDILLNIATNNVTHDITVAVEP